LITYLCLGSNLGERLNNISETIRLLSRYGKIIKASAVYETEPVGGIAQPLFLNSVLAYDFPSSPFELLSHIHKIENHLGRIRGERFGPRTIDIDILFFGELIIDSPALKIPHPELIKRLFVLTPLMEIAPSLLHPLEGSSIKDIYNNIYENNYYCKRYADPHL